MRIIHQIPIAVLTLFFMVTSLIAQEEDSTMVLNPDEYAFMMHEETNFLLKSNLPELGIVPRWGVNYKLNVSGEFRLKGDFTAEIGTDLFSQYSDNLNYHRFEPFAGVRWYYSQLKKRKAGISRQNMSANYIGLETVYIRTTQRLKEPEYAQTNTNSSYQVALKWGVQRRFLQHGLFDVGLKAGIREYVYRESKPQFFIESDMNFALALAKDKKELDKDLLCPILLCHSNRGMAFKINLYDVLAFSFSNGRSNFSFQPNISYEKRLFQWPLSIQADLYSRIDFSYQFQYLSSTILPNEVQVGRIYYSGGLQLRYYHNLNKRILKGLSGDGLSANYFGFETSYDGVLVVLERNQNFVVEQPEYFLRTPVYRLKYGIQRFYGKHFYFDYSLSYSLNQFFNEYFGNDHSVRFQIQLMVGYRF